LDTLDPDAISLARSLEGLPLALATTGTYLKQSADSFGDYPKLCIDKWDDLHQYISLLFLYSPYRRRNVCDAFVEVLCS
jgi:hypothetical protein